MKHCSNHSWGTKENSEMTLKYLFLWQTNPLHYKNNNNPRVRKHKEWGKSDKDADCILRKILIVYKDTHIYIHKHTHTHSDIRSHINMFKKDLLLLFFKRCLRKGK